MIFVTVGTFSLPFDRLIEAADELAEHEEVVVQCGGSRIRPIHCTTFDFVPAREFVTYIQKARVVVSHAGLGSVAACLRAQKRPIVVPRLQRLHENVDDHQSGFARQIEALGLALVVDDVRELPDAVLSHISPLNRSLGLSHGLYAELVEFVEAAIARS